MCSSTELRCLSHRSDIWWGYCFLSLRTLTGSFFQLEELQKMFGAHRIKNRSQCMKYDGSWNFQQFDLNHLFSPSLPIPPLMCTPWDQKWPLTMTTPLAAPSSLSWVFPKARRQLLLLKKSGVFFKNMGGWKEHKTHTKQTKTHKNNNDKKTKPNKPRRKLWKFGEKKNTWVQRTKSENQFPRSFSVALYEMWGVHISPLVPLSLFLHPGAVPYTQVLVIPDVSAQPPQTMGPEPLEGPLTHILIHTHSISRHLPTLSRDLPPWSGFPL